jgi:hypothetical protein
MWWLQFEEGNAAVVTAASLVQARLIAAAQGLGRASKFVEGYEIDAEFLQFIPGDNFIGKELSHQGSGRSAGAAASRDEVRFPRRLDEAARSHPGRP